MCLVNCASYVQRLLNSKSDTIICYKFLDKIENKLMSPISTGMEYKPGINKSNSRQRKVCQIDGIGVGPGIHVWRSHKIADSRRTIGRGQVIVKFTALKTDLLGASIPVYGHLVFKKVTLSQKEYDKHIKPKKKLKTNTKLRS